MPSRDEPSTEAAARRVWEELQALVTGALADETSPEGRRRLHEEWEKRFGETVQQWRHTRGWSQEHVAQRLREQGFDLHQTTVAKIERGTRPLRVAEAAALALIFGVPPLTMFYGPGPEDQPEALKALQQEMDDAQKELDIATEILDQAGEVYAVASNQVKSLARQISEISEAASKLPKP